MNFSSLSAEILKEERKRLGLNQAEAAEKCGVSREIWGRYERGSAVPGGDVLKALADLGADVQYILVGPSETAADGSVLMRVYPDEHLLLKGYRNLKPKKRQNLLASLLTGGDGGLDSKRDGVNVTGSGNRTAGRDYHEE